MFQHRQVYHRERIQLSSTLSCIGETEKNTPLQSPNLPWIFTTSIIKTPVETHHFNHQTSRGYSQLQSPNLPWKHTTSITKPPVESHHFNHQTSRGKAHSYQSGNRWKTHGLGPVFLYTVQTVADDLRQGEHIPKMQNDIGHKSKLGVLRQRGGKEAGGGGAGCHAVPCRDVTCRAGPRRAALGLALRSAQLA
jgi:hypothetical protein